MPVSAANQIADEWKFSSDGAKEYISFLLSDYICIGIKNEEGSLVGYYLQQWYGAIGMLYVTESCRGKGFAKALIFEISKRILDSGHSPFCYIEKDNLASLKLHSSCGFSVQDGFEYSWTNFSPNQDKRTCRNKCCV